MKPLLLVPLDDRPCCRQFPRRLAALAGVDLLLPPRRLLGRYLRPGCPEAVLDWLEAEAPRASGALVSLDMICWGGLIASRAPGPSLRTARIRLERLARLARGLPCWVFQSLLRTAPTQTSTAQVEEVGLLVEASRRLARGEEPPPALPRSALERYLGIRRRNHALNRAALDLLAAGAFRFLLLGMDDSRTEGLNVVEARYLAERIEREELPAVVAPGTDEMALLILARARGVGETVAVRWSEPWAPARETRYEDRPLGAVVEAQLRAAGLRQDPEASRQLWIYAPWRAQTEASAQGSGRSRRARRFVQELTQVLGAGRQVALAEVARANGADRALARELVASGAAFRLVAYAAWNTAGNALGTSLAALALAPEESRVESEKARRRFLLERLADDWLYQAEVRPRLFPGGSFHQMNLEDWKRARREVRRAMARWLRRVLPGVEARFDFPWRRGFEVEVEARMPAGPP